MIKGLINQPIKKFNPNSHWSIDRWWTEKEKIDLGVIEIGKTMKFEEFPQILEEASNNILTLKDELIELSDESKLKKNKSAINLELDKISETNIDL